MDGVGVWRRWMMERHDEEEREKSGREVSLKAACCYEE